MKSYYLFFLLLMGVLPVHSQSLFTYGSHTVSKEEFLKAYNKNNAETRPTESSYREYLDLYVRFKLKVQAAFDAHLDTLVAQQAELKAFRSQVAGTYMNDEASTRMLIEEAMQRGKKDILVSHIYIAVPAGADEAQQKKAAVKAATAYSRLQKGEDFAAVAKALSEDPDVQENKGLLGYITALVLPYEMENVVYATPVNKFSAPYRSKIGYHIFKNQGTRPAIGRMRAAQILLSFPPDAGPEVADRIKLLADSLYDQLKKGSDFKELALHFSNDNITYQNGGEMQEFGVGRYESAFESAAFGLAADGEISKPVRSAFGYHLIKRIARIPVQADIANPIHFENYRQLVSQNDRMGVSQKVMLKKILAQTGYKAMPVEAAALKQFTDSILAGAPAPKRLPLQTVLFTFPDKKITAQDWSQFLSEVRNFENLRTGKSPRQLLDQYVEAVALEYYRDHLEKYNSEFAFQLKEFKEGNLLFEIMQRKIWDAAALDSTGLRQYYNSHQQKYWWEPSADALIITCTNDSVAKVARQKIEQDPAGWRQLLENSDGTMQGDSSRFELAQLPVADKTVFNENSLTTTLLNETDNSATFCYIRKIYRERAPRSFNDARGFVINDYQTALEEKWIEALKKKYPVIINAQVLKSLPK